MADDVADEVADDVANEVAGGVADDVSGEVRFRNHGQLERIRHTLAPGRPIGNDDFTGDRKRNSAGLCEHQKVAVPKCASPAAPVPPRQSHYASQANRRRVDSVHFGDNRLTRKTGNR